MSFDIKPHLLTPEQERLLVKALKAYDEDHGILHLPAGLGKAQRIVEPLEATELCEPIFVYDLGGEG